MLKYLNNNIINLYNKSSDICVSHKCDKWSNSWMWNIYKTSLIYYHLIYITNDYTFHYENINDTEIRIEYDIYHKNYRIDIKTRYKLHKFWIFDDKDWINVELYVVTIIKLEYNSLHKLYSLTNLIDNAYITDQPTTMYQKMNIIKRKEKLKKLKKLQNDNKE